MDRQIPLELSGRETYAFQNFVIGESNRFAVTSLKNWRSWSSPVLLICGPEFCGKTHLLSAWAHENDGKLYSGDVQRDNRIGLDDANQYDEEVLFTLTNMALNGHIEALVLTSRLMPSEWGVELPDLISRLSNIPAANISEPDDDILDAILRKFFEDKGRVVSKDLVSYLLKSQDRSIPGLKSIVDALDLSARETKRDLTRAFAANFLKSLD